MLVTDDVGIAVAAFRLSCIAPNLRGRATVDRTRSETERHVIADVTGAADGGRPQADGHIRQVDFGRGADWPWQSISRLSNVVRMRQKARA